MINQSPGHVPQCSQAHNLTGERTKGITGQYEAFSLGRQKKRVRKHFLKEQSNVPHCPEIEKGKNSCGVALIQKEGK